MAALPRGASRRARAGNGRGSLAHDNPTATERSRHCELACHFLIAPPSVNGTEKTSSSSNPLSLSSWPVAACSLLRDRVLSSTPPPRMHPEHTPRPATTEQPHKCSPPSAATTRRGSDLRSHLPRHPPPARPPRSSTVAVTASPTPTPSSRFTLRARTRSGAAGAGQAWAVDCAGGAPFGKPLMCPCVRACTTFRGYNLFSLSS